MFISHTPQLPRKLGFTLVELVIIIAIISVLASLAFLMLSSETAQARDSKRMSDIKIIENSIDATLGKNKDFQYAIDFEHTSRVTDQDSYQTNTGFFFPLRGGFLIPLMNGVFDSSILPQVPLDPKGGSYLAVFLSPKNYQIFGTLENVDTKIPTAYVKGPFQEGAILDKISADIDTDVNLIIVSHPENFVAGDVIRIEGEYMVITGLDIPNKTVFVYRDQKLPDGNGTDNAKEVHNTGAYVKLYRSAPGAKALLCKNGLGNASVGNKAKTVASDDSGIINEAMGEIDVNTVNATSWGNVCNDPNDVVEDLSRNVPYKVTN